jgi:hypothetical protein
MDTFRPLQKLKLNYILGAQNGSKPCASSLPMIAFLDHNETEPMDDEPKVVHCKKDKFDVYIGRPSKWGNPFAIGKDGTREQVIEKYRSWIPTQPELIAALPELKDKVLGCWCAPQACHGDVLAKLANSRDIDQTKRAKDLADQYKARDVKTDRDKDHER